MTSRIEQALAGAEKPLSLSALGRLLKAKDEPLQAALRAAVDAGRIYRWPDFRRSQYFWHIAPDAKAREEILKAAGICPLSKTLLVKAAKKQLAGFSEARVETLIKVMLAEKQLQQVPGFAGSARLLIKSGAREAYLKAAYAYIEERIRKAGFHAGEEAAPRGDAAEEILAAVRFLEPVTGVPVGTLRLRNHLPGMSKSDFDRGALELRRRQAVFLSVHADPYNLNPEDRELLIDGQDGTFYVAIALR